MVSQLLVLLLAFVLTLLPIVFALITLNSKEWKLFWSYTCKRWRMFFLKPNKVLINDV